MKSKIFLIILSFLSAVFLFLTIFQYIDNKNVNIKYINEINYMTDKRDSLNKVISNVLEKFNNKDYLIENLKLEIQSLKTDEYYMLVSIQKQYFWVKKRDKILWEGPCATGVGKVTRAGKEYDFSTPLGERIVIGKKDDPYWIRPNWYWKEQGLEVPADSEIIWMPDTFDFAQSIEYYNNLTPEEKLFVREVPGALGNYTLNLGNGYLIHKGRIGRGIYSHGCIRLRSSDLEIVDSLVPSGSSVFIF